MLPQRPDFPQFLIPHELQDILHDIKPAHPKAEFQPALRIAIILLNKQTGNQIGKLRCCRIFRMIRLCRILKELEHTAAARRASAILLLTHIKSCLELIEYILPALRCRRLFILFLLLLNGFEYRYRMLTGTQILLGSRAVAVTALNTIGIPGQPDINRIQLTALYLGMEPGIIIIQRFTMDNRTLIEIAYPAAICQITGNRTDCHILQQNDSLLFLYLCLNLLSFLC